MAVPSIVAYGAPTNIAGFTWATTNIPYPAGIANDDLCIVFGVMGQHASDAPTISAGWTVLRRNGANGGRGELWCAYKIFATGDAQPAIAVGNKPAGNARTVAIRGVDTSVPIDFSGDLAAFEADSTINIPACTSTVGDVLQIVLAGNLVSQAVTLTPAPPLVEGTTKATADTYQLSYASGPSAAGAITARTISTTSTNIHGYINILIKPSSGGGSSTPITFTGTIPNQTFTNGQAVSVNLAPYFSGTLTPFTFAAIGASLVGSGLSINTSGLLSGTAITSSIVGAGIIGTDSALNTASSNLFDITVSAASTPVGFTGTAGAITGTAGTAITPVDLSTYFSGSLTPFTYSVFSGSLPAGLLLNSSTGVISGTPTGASSGSVVVRATDTGSNTADTNSFAVTISAVVGTITSQPLCRNNGVTVGVVSLNYIDVDNPSTGALVLRKTGVSTDGSGVFTFSDALLTTGIEYRINWLESTGQFGTAFVVAS